ncbi:MAG: endonuclease III [Gammaproteobacteria bacterium]
MADARKITTRLLKAYPDAGIDLNFSTPLELLVATLLSAQCTDARVNEVTAKLFRKYRNAADYANARTRTFETEIHSTGFYKNKARAVIDCCKRLVADFGGQVPRTTEELTSLPGVGRKTAHMVLGNAFGQAAIAVDTHVLRVSQRLGLAQSRNADKAEQELAAEVPQKHWTAFTNAMILHGRGICTARSPHCCECALYDLCAWTEKPHCADP